MEVAHSHRKNGTEKDINKQWGIENTRRYYVEDAS